jgi:hypothetical protein
VEGLIEERKYEPDYSEYKGPAYFAEIEFETVKLPWIFDNFARWLADTTESKIKEKGGHPLWTQIYRYETFLSYKFDLKFWFYSETKESIIVTEMGTFVAPVVWGIIEVIILAAAALLGIWLINRTVKTAGEIIWGPEEVPWYVRALIPLGISIILISWGISKLKEVKTI